MDKPVIWLPRNPCPPVPFDVKARIEQLRSYLDPNNSHYQRPQQHENIKAVIRLYEEGKINGVDSVYVQRGKIIALEDILKNPGSIWAEGMSYQRVQKCTYGHGPFDDTTHEIRMHLRLIPELGGDGTFCGVIVLNDTGSNIFTVFTSDFQHLGNTQEYDGWIGDGSVTDANGTATVLPQLIVQVRLVDNHSEPWSDWIFERAIVRTPHPSVDRLSGRGFRDVFYIGTGPGNHVLAVSASKGGLTTLL